MTDATISAESVSAPPRAAAAPVRPGRFSDIALVHRRLMECIDGSPFYGETFKAHEKARLSKDYLAALIDADPHHVLVFEQDGETAGFMLSAPEFGTLWLHWTYVFPEKRRSSLAMSGVRAFITHWDNGRFHKIATYTKPGNDAAKAVMERLGFAHVATLENQIFGEDYLLYERRLTKTEPGYDHGVGGGIGNRVRRRLKRLLVR